MRSLPHAPHQPPPPICPVCGLEANATNVRVDGPAGTIRIGLYVCPLEHPWTTRWLEPSPGSV